jgi:phenylacetate-CoA ligase
MAFTLGLILPDRIYDCNTGGRIMGYIQKRKENYILASDGRWVGRFDHSFKATQDIQDAQIEQHRPGHFIIRIEKGKGYPGQNEKAIIKEAIVRLGKYIQIEFDYVPQITKDSPGKYRFIFQKPSFKSLMCSQF